MAKYLIEHRIQFLLKNILKYSINKLGLGSTALDLGSTAWDLAIGPTVLDLRLRREACVMEFGS